MREEILRGIYEENLRIVGKHPPMMRKEKTLFFSKFICSVAIIVLFTLTSTTQLTPLSLPGNLFYNSTVLQSRDIKASDENERTPPNPADYDALIDYSKIPLSKMFGLGVKTIIIDPGHGGADPGTIGRMGTKEKDITLDIGKRLYARLTKYGKLNVVMTRNEDVSLSPSKRVESALYKKADLFLSIHLNYLPAKPYNIIETYYFGPSSDESTLSLVQKENAGSPLGMSHFKEIIEKLEDTIKLQESRALAISIQRSLFANIRRESKDTLNYGVKRAPFVVLLGVDVPAVLAEVSCLSNFEEETRINTAPYRDDIARYLEEGILEYLRKGETPDESEITAER